MAATVMFFALITAVSSTHSCKDRDQRCPRWKREGECQKNPSFMHSDCAFSCGVCSAELNHENVEQFVYDAWDMQLKVFCTFAALFVGGIFAAAIKLRYAGSMCRSKGSLRGKTIVITGCTSGIGHEAAIQLALRGAQLIIGCRTIKEGIKLKENLYKETGSKKIDIKKLDLASLDSVREFAKDIMDDNHDVHMLINNAGVVTGKTRTTTVDGLETTFQVNYLGPFLLTKLLLEKLKSCAPSRIINAVSEDYSKGDLDFSDLQSTKEFCNWKAYQDSNLAKMLFTHELSKRLQNSGVTVNSASPGTCVTNLYRNVFPYDYKLTWLIMLPITYLFWRSANTGQETIYYCALEKELENVSGKLFADCASVKINPIAEDDGRAKKLFEISERLAEPRKLSLKSSLLEV